MIESSGLAMPLSLWVFIYAAAALQAALLAVSLWRHRGNRAANRLLAVWVALVGFDLVIKAGYWHHGSAAWLPAWHFAKLLPFLYASLFYLYVRALVVGRGLTIRDAPPFAGFAAMLALKASVWLSRRWPGTALTDAVGALAASVDTWFGPILLAWSLPWIIAALVRVSRYRRDLRARRADADRYALHWIDAMAWCQIAIWTMAVVVTIDPQRDSQSSAYALLFGLVAAWVFVVGWFSLNQPPLVVEAAATPMEPAPPAEPAPLDDPRFDAVLQRLEQLMAGAEPLYRKPALAISEVARRSGYPEYLVSAVINRRLGASFWDYVNRLRIDAVCRCLRDPDDRRTLLDIAYDCGFTSKSTFNAAFKRQTGQTPSAYRKATAGADSDTPKA